MIAVTAARPITDQGPIPLRFSRLKLMGRSPAHCKFAIDQDAAGVDGWDDTASKRLGRLAHAVFLGQGLPIVFPGERRGNVWKAFKEENVGKDIVTQDELDTVRAMTDKLDAHPEAKVLRGDWVEQTFQFTLRGRLCRGTPDSFTPALPLADYKTTTDASPERFPWQALKLGYHAQVVFYKDGLVSLGKFAAPSELVIVAQETKAPYAVCVFPLTSRAEDFGRRTYSLWLERFLVCEQSNTWPAYGPGSLDAPEDSELIGLDGEVIE